MTASDIQSSYDAAIQLADQRLVERATKRIQELLRIVQAEKFCTGKLYVCSGNGGSSIEAEGYLVKDIHETEEPPYIAPDSYSLDDTLLNPKDYLHEVVATEKALAALTEIAKLCALIVNANVTTVVPWKIFPDSVTDSSY